MKIRKEAINSAQSSAGTAVYIDYRDAAYDGSISCYTYHGIDDASIYFQHLLDFSQAKADYQGPDCVGGVHPEIAEELGYGNDTSEDIRDYYNSGDWYDNLDMADTHQYIYWVN